MKTTLFRVCAVAGLMAGLTLLAGCLQFQNKLNLAELPAPAGENQQAVFDAPDEWPDDNLGDVMPEDLAAEPAAEPSEPASDATDETTPTQTDETAAPSDAPAQDVTAAPGMSVAEYVSKLGQTQYDILRSNRFSMVATTTNGNEVTKMKMALGDNKTYVVSEIEDGIEVGMYIVGDKTYIYYPKGKKYMELTDAVASMIGIDSKQFTSMADSMGFDMLPLLSTAQSMENTTLKGTSCKVFHFGKQSTNGKYLNAYLSGRKLLRLEYLDDNRNITSAMDFTSISSGFPQMPPSGYTKTNVAAFVALLAKDMT